MAGSEDTSNQDRPSFARQLTDEPRSESTVSLPLAIPSAESGQLRAPQTPGSQSINSSGSDKTISDKLSELPLQLMATPPNAVRTLNGPSRPYHSSLDNHLTGTHSGFMPPSDVRAPSSPPYSSPFLPISHGHQASLRQAHYESDSSLSRDSPSKQRVSFDSDRGSINAHPRQRTTPAPEPNLSVHATHTPFPSLFNARHAQDASHTHTHTHMHTHTHTRSRKDSTESLPQSRATSPLRAIFDRWPALHHVHSREEPFLAVDPFRARHTFSFTRCFQRIPPSSSNASTAGSMSIFTDVDIECDDACCFPKHTRPAHVFVTDTLPRQMYLHMLMRLPSLYFTRVARIFEDAEVSRPEMQRMIEACFPRDVGSTRGHGHGHALPFAEEWTPPTVSPALVRFRHSWEAFIDSLIREWKTLNVVSALLLSAILTMFQIPDAANDPLTRTAALLSLVCALMSLSYGCIYIVRFGTMRSMIRASRWAEEAQKTKTSILWNVWVLLAAPAVWLAWSMIAFVVSILSFVWRTGSTSDPTSDDPAENPRILSPGQALGPRVAITAVLVLGLVYFAMIVITFRSYGSGRWSRRASKKRADGDVEGGGGPDQDETRAPKEGEESRGRRRERRRGKSALGLGLSGTGAPAKSPLERDGDPASNGKMVLGITVDVEKLKDEDPASNGKMEMGTTVDVEKVEDGPGEDEVVRASNSVSPLGI